MYHEMKKRYWLLCLLSVFWFIPQGMSQTLYHVITKKVEKTFSYRDGYELNIEGEKAEVVRTTCCDEFTVTYFANRLLTPPRPASMPSKNKIGVCGVGGVVRSQ